MSDTCFHSATGVFQLERRPPTPNQPLRAWDAADEYLLERAAEFAPGRSLVINDSFGALAVALGERPVESWSDSYTAHLALADNLMRNSAAPDRVTPLPATERPAGRYDLVLWRLPRNTALLRQQVAWLQRCVDERSIVLAGGMIKHLPEQAVDLLRQLGAVEIQLAQKKARLFRVTPDPTLPPPPPPAEKPLRIADHDLLLTGDANVFSRDKFDIGARFFLEQFPRLPRAGRIADLGCGNGVLGIVAQRSQPDAQLVFFDESYQAVAAARSNYHNAIKTSAAAAQFIVDDCLSHYQGEAFDLILCNPPFHQNHVVGDQIAWRMLVQSARHLRPHGQLWIVGNRHLQYHIKLKRVFGHCLLVAGNPKFVVLAARKTGGNPPKD